jgi:hypothetical protein
VAQGVAEAFLISAKSWSEWQDLNLRPPRPERGALPTTTFVMISVAPNASSHEHVGIFVGIVAFRNLEIIEITIRSYHILMPLLAPFVF